MMAYATPITADMLLVAIDVAKRSHEVLVQWPGGKRKTFHPPSTHSEFVLFTNFLAGQGLQVRAALEPTADFHRTIAHWLLRHDVELHLASSLSRARGARSVVQLLGQKRQKGCQSYHVSSGAGPDKAVP